MLSNSFHTISIHRKRHKYPQNDIEWGYYLAGLIDADGHFTDVSTNNPNLTICFHLKDISLAYKIKKYITYGTVSKIKDKNACKYVLTNKRGFTKLLPVLYNKLLHIEKQKRFKLLCNFYQINDTELNTNNFENSKNCPVSDYNLLGNHWFAGFIDGDGSLQIKIIKKKNRKNPEIRLQLQIDLNAKCEHILNIIKNNFGGNIYYRKAKNSFYYNSTSFLVFEKIINNLDIYSLCSNKYKEYILWRKAFFLRTKYDQIAKIKNRLSNLKR